jgi:broad specificity phosphatase PhoE
MPDQGQAHALAQALVHRPCNRIVCSPLLRARQTAEPLLQATRQAGRPAVLTLQPGLMEIDYGDFQGLLKDDRPLTLRRSHRHQRMPGGESLADVFERVSAVARELADQVAAGQAVSVVGHFWSNRMLRGALLGLTLEQTLAMGDYKPGNGSFVHLALPWPAGTAGQRRHAAQQPEVDA